MRYVVTGGMGFFGSIMTDYLLDSGNEVLVIDCLVDSRLTQKYNFKQVDIENYDLLLNAITEFGHIDGIFHIAAILGHDKEHKHKLFTSNVTGTKNIMEIAQKLNNTKVVFTSTNCVFGSGSNNIVAENHPTNPIEDYGRSKLEAEKVILSYPNILSSIIRCPTIIAAGRLGLLTILFDFIMEERKVYLVGDGHNRYSFIYALDLADACYKAMLSDKSGLYHISSDNVPSMKELYSEVANRAHKKIKLVNLPEFLVVPALKLLYDLNLSPLGPYHYRMLAANFVLDNTKIKEALNWQPTKTNIDMLSQAYEYYVEHYQEIQNAQNLPAHKLKAKAGILNLLKMIS